MNTTPSQIARGSDDTASLVFAVQGRVVSVQRIGGQWQEVFAAGMMSSSNTPCMVAPPPVIFNVTKLCKSPSMQPLAFCKRS